MAKGSITQVAVTDTFQQWLNKTNDLVNLMNGDVMTASPGGDSTIGNSTLVGNFTANNVTVNATTGKFTGMSALVSEIRQQTGNAAPIAVADMLAFSIANTLPIRLTYSQGPRIRFDNTQRTWDVGHGGSAANSSFTFVWDSSVLGAVTTAGYLELIGGLTANGNTTFGSGRVLVGSGVVANPGLAFSAEANTGIYRPAANTIAASVWGIQRLSISNTSVTANVQYRGLNGGIGTPAYSFTTSQNSGMFFDTDLRFAVAGNVAVSFGPDSAFSEHGIALYTKSGTSGTSITSNGHLNIDAGNSIGIRVGRSSLISRFSVLKPNTSTTFVNIQAGDNPAGTDATANGGFVQVWQGPNTALPAFSFVGDITTGFGRTDANTISIVIGGLSVLRTNSTSISTRGGVGLAMDNYVGAAHRGDVSPHLSLYGYGTTGNYGLGVTGSSFNIAAPPSAAFRFVSSVDGNIAAELYNNSGSAIFRMGGSGTASSPAFSFIDDPDTGLWRYASNGLGITAGGTERARFGTQSQFFGTVSANAFSVINVGSGGGFQGVAADTAENPSFAWTGDWRTGMWHYGSNAIGFATAGLNRVVISGGGITVQNDGRFYASNIGAADAPDFTFSGAGGYGMWYASSYLRFSAASTQVIAVSPSYNIHYSTYTRLNNLRWNSNTNDGFSATSNYAYAIVADTYSHRFDLNGAVVESVITRGLGDARYQRTSSRRFKDKLVEINSSLEERLLKAFDLFNIKTWTWGKEIAVRDERYGTQGIGFVVEELEEFLPEAVRYQWIQDEDFDADSDDIPTKKQPHALDESPILASLVLKIRQLEARLAALEA